MLNLVAVVSFCAPGCRDKPDLGRPAVSYRRPNPVNSSDCDQWKLAVSRVEECTQSAWQRNSNVDPHTHANYIEGALHDAAQATMPYVPQPKKPYTSLEVWALLQAKKQAKNALFWARERSAFTCYGTASSNGLVRMLLDPLMEASGPFK